MEDCHIDIEKKLGVRVNLIHAIRIVLRLNNFSDDDKAEVNVVRLCVFGEEDKPFFRMCIDDRTTTWHTSVNWTDHEIKCAQEKSAGFVSLLEPDDALEDVYYVVFSDPSMYSQLKEGITVLDYVEATIKYDLISSRTRPSTTGKEAAKKLYNTSFKRELARVKAGKDQPFHVKRKIRHRNDPDDRIRNLLEEVYLPHFRKLLRRPREPFDHTGRTKKGSLDDVAMKDHRELDKRFHDDSADIFISFARLIKKQKS